MKILQFQIDLSQPTVLARVVHDSSSPGIFGKASTQVFSSTSVCLAQNTKHQDWMEVKLNTSQLRLITPPPHPLKTPPPLFSEI